PSFIPFLSQVDNLLSELDREASRQEAQRQRQQRKRAFRARFDVNENKEAYQIDGEVPGFEQEHISIEVTDEHTLKVAGNTEQQTEAAPAADAQTTTAEVEDKMDGPKEPKGKEPVTETAVQKQPQPEVPAQQSPQPENREWLSERVHGSFERTFRFPERIDATNVRASLKNGVLNVVVPKAQAPEVRRIVIQ
ncbi:HSP20-like chaperone, partial [Massariosphaeria phaeospora]